jgi:RecB family exonuclease
MVEDVRRSLEALSAEDQRGEFVPAAYEAAFGLGDEPPLVVRDPASDETFQLRGLIDRVDRAPGGGVRVIDYKTGGPSSYRKSAIRDGEKLQLPLYALAARDALGLGQPLSGFYWHVRHAEPSPFKLEDYGPAEAMEAAVGYAWEAIRGARAGRFPPEALKGACPPYCPAVGFCWRYQPRYR